MNFWEQIVGFFSFQDINVRYVALGSLLLGAGSALVGCFAFLRKKALIGDTISHSILPGICMGFMLFGTKDPLVLLGGAMFTGWISVFVVDYITRHSKIKADAAIGLTLSVFFGIGILLLTHIQHSGASGQAGLDKFLFGKAASMLKEDVMIFGLVSVLLVLCVWLFYKPFKLLSFDQEFAKVVGLNVKLFELILSAMTVLAVAIGIQTVGVVLMAAMLITPAATARFWTNKLKTMLYLAAIVGAVSGLIGAFISYIAPAMPTGPWIVVVLSVASIGSLLFAPKKGIVAKINRRRSNEKKILLDNVLKLLFKLGEKEGNYFIPRSLTQLREERGLPTPQLLSGLKSLKSDELLVQVGKNWVFTEKGLEEGRRIVKLHRLWELYLTTYLRIAPDHVHEDAETIEHIITPELEFRLEKLLNFPEEDPHQTKIPYKE